MSELSEFGRAALEYIELGFAVIPLAPCGKHPVTAHGLNDWSDNPKNVTDYWSKHPGCNVGIVCGQPSHGLLVIDIDVDENKDKDGYASLREWETLNGTLPSTCVSVTGSGGMHYLYRVDREIRPSANPDLGIDIRCDKSYVVAPPSIHPNGRRYEWQDPPDETPVSDADATVYALVDYLQRTGEINDLDVKKSNGKFNLPDVIKEGKRDETLYKYACHLRALGRSDDEILLSVMGANATRCRPPMDDAAVRKTVRSACKHEPGKSEAYKDDETVEVRTIEPSSSGILKTVEQITGFITATMGQSIGVSMPCKRPFVRGALPWDQSGIVRPWTDYDYSALYGMLEPMGVRENKLVHGLTNAMHQCEFWPVRDLLDNLPEWDGKTRPIDVFYQLLGVDPSSEYNVFSAGLFMMGAVARAYRPGCKFDYTPILIGPPGCGKSSFARAIAMDDTLFTDTIQNLSDIKVTEEAMQGKWIGELPELTGMSGKAVESIKAILTRTSYDARPPYGRYTETYPRGYVFLGTSNGSGVPNDPSGALARRLLPMRTSQVEHINVTEWSRSGASELIRQAWAGAVQSYKAAGGNVTLILPDRLNDVASVHRDDATEEDVDRSRVIEFLDMVRDRAEYDGKTPRVNVVMVCRCCLEWSSEFISRNKKETAHIAAILDNVDGWHRCKSKQLVTWEGQSYGTAKTWECNFAV